LQFSRCGLYIKRMPTAQPFPAGGITLSLGSPDGGKPTKDWFGKPSQQDVELFLWFLLASGNVATRTPAVGGHQKVQMQGNFCAYGLPTPGIRGSDLTRRIYACVRVLELTGETNWEACRRVVSYLEHRLGRTRRGRRPEATGLPDADAAARAPRTPLPGTTLRTSICRPCWERAKRRVPAIKHVAGTPMCHQCWSGKSLPDEERRTKHNHISNTSAPNDLLHEVNTVRSLYNRAKDRHRWKEKLPERDLELESWWGQFLWFKEWAQATYAEAIVDSQRRGISIEDLCQEIQVRYGNLSAVVSSVIKKIREIRGD
jgi:hypothetical protein